MQNQHFDSLTRALGSSHPRRRVFKTAAALITGALFASPPEHAFAAVAQTAGSSLSGVCSQDNAIACVDQALRTLVTKSGGCSSECSVLTSSSCQTCVSRIRAQAEPVVDSCIKATCAQPVGTGSQTHSTSPLSPSRS